MNIKHGDENSGYGPGVDIELDGNEVAQAINNWLVSKGICISGPRTVMVNGELCKSGRIYVDQSGFVLTKDGKKLSGRGKQSDVEDFWVVVVDDSNCTMRVGGPGHLWKAKQCPWYEDCWLLNGASSPYPKSIFREATKEEIEKWKSEKKAQPL